MRTTWAGAARRALWSGSAASVLSALILAVCGRVENRAAAGPLNGPSQWVFGEGAAYRRNPSFLYTAIGYSIHHLMSLGWATVHEKHIAGLAPRNSAGGQCVAAIATAAIAWVVDYRMARGRLQPGFDKQLSRISLALVYAAFAAGLVLGRPGSSRGHRRHSRHPDRPPSRRSVPSAKTATMSAASS